MPSPPFSVAILVGGASRRYGSDKALAHVGAEPMLSRVITRLSAVTDDLFLVGGEAARYHTLGVPAQGDLRPGMGALSGLHAALTRARHESVLVVACDMPFASPALAEYLAGQTTELDAVVPRSAAGLEPLHALYRRSCLRPLESLLDAGGGSLREFLTRVRHRVIEADTVLRLCGSEDPFWNVNTPEDLARLEAALRRRSGA